MAASAERGKLNVMVPVPAESMIRRVPRRLERLALTLPVWVAAMRFPSLAEISTFPVDVLATTVFAIPASEMLPTAPLAATETNRGTHTSKSMPHSSQPSNGIAFRVTFPASLVRSTRRRSRSCWFAACSCAIHLTSLLGHALREMLPMDVDSVVTPPATIEALPLTSFESPDEPRAPMSATATTIVAMRNAIIERSFYDLLERVLVPAHSKSRSTSSKR